MFAAILGCSQLTYVEAVMTQRKEDLVKVCENALHYFGGVPAAIVPDNLRSAVTKSSKYEPIINETFADFAARTGSEAKARQVLGNINNLIALRVMDAETQQYITDNLPKTRSGKIMRRLLRSLAKGEAITQDTSTLENPAILSQLGQAY